MTAHVVAPRTYYLVFAVLMGLTLLTVGASFLELGPLHTAVALLIAATKALLVVLFFMHVLYSPRLIWVVTLGSLFWLGILLSLTLADYWTRPWLAP
jgi:cytochrome c oxidase subunit 4